jgi:polysaccharide deacetylase 2 family uncharacterized protein YibQ
MDRRGFLIKSTFYLLGSYLGLNSLSKAFGSGKSIQSPQFSSRIALIIDDIGYSPSLARQFLGLGIPITFSVLPHLPNSQNLAVEIRYKGHEIMLHQPMEPYNAYYDPGPGALYVGFKANEIARIMKENITAVPYAVGVNNHMGSKFTSSQREIKETLWVVKDNGLFFVDSLTSSRSRAYRTARRLHISTACRNIFLDNVLDESAILVQLYKLKQHAIRYGRAIGIGHPFPETSRAVAKFLSTADPHDISFVHASRILAT